jgi:hypothetical protein
MTISTITIEAVGYTAYADVAQADSYLNIDPARETTWEALTTDEKGKKLVAATRRLDLLNWQGAKTDGDDAQENAWPRTGLTFKDGSAVSTIEVPQEVENAVILLAGSVALDADVADSGTSGSNTRRVKAGSAEVEFFRAVSGTPLQDRTAYDLVKQFLEGAGVDETVGGLASGDDEESSFADSDIFGVANPYP